MPGVALAQSSPSPVVLTTKHFAFSSDLATNVHDALLDAGTARRAKQAELFAAGAEKACFDRLPAAERDAWTRSVESYATSKATDAQHILGSSKHPNTQDRAALEVIFHEASHALTTVGSPLGTALAAAVRESGGTLPRIPLLHAVHFAISGEAVRRAYAQSGGAPYTPYLYSLKMLGDAFNDVAARIWPAYVDGTRTLPQAVAETVRALVTPARGN